MILPFMTAISVLATITAASPKGRPYPYPAEWKSQATLYFMTNEAQNAVVALPIAQDGSLSSWTTTGTGGLGGSLVSPTDGSPNGPDSIGAQGCVQVADNLVLAVNPTSNTISSLGISWHDPTDINLLNQVDTNGDFPVSIGVSEELKIACVGHSGVQSGVTCAPYTTSGIGNFDALRALPLGQTSPPTGPLNGIAQVLFNHDSSSLIVIVKGNGSMPDSGYVAVYPVISGQVSYTPMKTSPADTAVMFGSALIPGTNNLLMSDAGFGYLILSLSDLSTPLAVTKITDQMATCWSEVSPYTGTGFVDDVVVSHLVEVDLTTGALIQEVPCGNGGQGMVDMRAVGDKIYAVSPGNGTVSAAVTVFDVSGGRGSAKSVQNLPIPGVGRFAEGLAVYYGK